MDITYSFDRIPTADQVIELYNAAGLPRPTDDKTRIQQMYENSNLIVTAWNGEKLMGVSRCITEPNNAYINTCTSRSVVS